MFRENDIWIQGMIYQSIQIVKSNKSNTFYFKSGDDVDFIMESLR